MNEQVEAYINSMIPINISKKDRALIRDEFASHLYDRIDFFIEIGYDEQASINKAIEEFGSKKEVRESIKNQLNDVYNEPLWLSFVAAAVVLIINVVASLAFESYPFATDFSYPIATAISFSVGFICMSAVIFMCVAAYKRGYSNTLLSIGITQITVPIILGLLEISSLFTTSMFLSMSFLQNICYLIDRFTPLSAIDVYSSYVIAIILTVAASLLELALSVLCICAATKLKKHGAFSNKRNINFKAFSICFAVIITASIAICFPAELYFYHYPSWFNTELDGITEDSQSIYDSIDNTSSFAKTDKMLKQKGYTTIKEYEATLDGNTAKKFRHEVKQLDFFFDENYEVYFNPQKIEYFSLSDADLSYATFPNDDSIDFDQNDEYEENESEEYTVFNGFIYLLEGEDGKVKSKGIGVGSRFPEKGNDRYSNESHVNDNTELCLEEFKNLKIGETKDDILKRERMRHEDVYTRFITYTDNGTNEYYRIYHAASMQTDEEMFIQVSFENNKLTSGTLIYNDDFQLKPRKEIVLTVK